MSQCFCLDPSCNTLVVSTRLRGFPASLGFRQLLFVLAACNRRVFPSVPFGCLRFASASFGSQFGFRPTSAFGSLGPSVLIGCGLICPAFLLLRYSFASEKSLPHPSCATIATSHLASSSGPTSAPLLLGHMLHVKPSNAAGAHCSLLGLHQFSGRHFSTTLVQ